MQIILLEKIANVGDLGDVVKVREGYARNYLIPQGKAKRATPDNLKAIEAKRSELEKRPRDVRGVFCCRCSTNGLLAALVVPTNLSRGLLELRLVGIDEGHVD